MTRSRKRRRKSNPSRLAKLAVVSLLAFTLYQFWSQGEVTWPGRLTDSVGDYATRPEAGWRRAAEGIGQLGAIREGRDATDFDLLGRVVGVADGDSLVLLADGGERHEVRLFGIDSPEWDQPHGEQARKALAGLVSRQQVGLVKVDTDGFGRTVATVYLEGRNINLAMVENGHAWWYRRYAPYERHLAEAEQQARQRSLGLWSDPDPSPPWEWRRRH